MAGAVFGGLTIALWVGRVSLFSAFTLSSSANIPELNSGALHRYLAEAVWYPTALLPQAGVQWSPIDEHSALATLTDNGETVSLEFRFNDAGEVTGKKILPIIYCRAVNRALFVSYDHILSISILSQR